MRMICHRGAVKLAGITVGLSLFLLSACFDAPKAGVQFAAQVQPVACPTGLPQTIQCFRVTGIAIGSSRTHWRALDRIAFVGGGSAVDVPFYCIPSTTRGQLTGSIGTVRFSGSGYFCPRADTAEFRYRLVDSQDAVNSLAGAGLILYDGHSNVEQFMPDAPASSARLSTAMVTAGADSRREHVSMAQARRRAVLDSWMLASDPLETALKSQPSAFFEDPWNCAGMFVESGRPVHAVGTSTADLDSRGHVMCHGERASSPFHAPEIWDSGEAAEQCSAYVFDNFSDVQRLVSPVWADAWIYPDQCGGSNGNNDRFASGCACVF